MRWRTRPPWLEVTLALAALAFVLAVIEGPHQMAQATVNGLVVGSYYALGAVGLTLVYGLLRFVNFAHGDMLTYGAYMALLARTTLRFPLAFAIAFAIVMTALLALSSELLVWRPLRSRRSGVLPLIIASLGFAFLLRNAIQFVAGSQQQDVGIDITSSVVFLGVRVGRTNLIVVIAGLAILLLIVLMLRYTPIGQWMRAMANNPTLAETTGVDTALTVLLAWSIAGGLAGLAGLLVGASFGVITPNLGFGLLLSLVAAAVIGGVGNAFGALAGGLILGLAQEWSTLLVPAQWKLAVGFCILIAVLLLRPRGMFAGASRAD